MRGQYVPPPAPDPDLVLNLALKVRELSARPGRWAWDLTDNRDGSWFESMWEFESAEEAAGFGRERLAELTDARGTAGRMRIANEIKRRLVIVSGQDDELYGLLNGLFANSKAVNVIRDRRQELTPIPRTRAERRSTRITDDAKARGWWIVTPRDPGADEVLDPAQSA
jgi:hypothetical protein